MNPAPAIRIPSHEIAAEEKVVVGSIPPDCLGLESDRFAHQVGPLDYKLSVSLAAHEIVVRGTASVTLSLVCSRCGSDFCHILSTPSFLASYPAAEHPEFLDVLPEVREELVLLIPAFPVCGREDCGKSAGGAGVAMVFGDDAGPTDEDHRWDALDKLKDL